MPESATITPAFDPNDNNAHLIYIPAGVFIVICPILMALRVWARLRKGGKLGADDWTAVAALYFFMAQVTYKAAINLIKASILLLYLRLFNIIRWFRYSCWALLAAVAMYCTASILVTIFQCRPMIRAFDKDTPGTCIDTAKFWFANAGFSIATDFIMLLLPMPLVWTLGVPIAQKMAVMAVFAIGIFATITSCLRVTTLDIFAKSPDNTYNVANVMWTIVEPNVAIVCACLPVLLTVPRVPPGYAGYGSNKSRVPLGSQNRTDGAGRDWVELGGVKSQGTHLASIGRRPGSFTGSEESILTGPQGQKEVPAPGIKKTVEYSIQYSKQQQE
ncbi:hypothetical protein N0V88_005212 [Collariella sp. IMI 366227]|nr:hypothetical protein N0V88_005212 [Collariella sp. IMI 366227]